jgi:hypothetical protein
MSLTTPSIPALTYPLGLVDEGPHQALVMQYYKRGTLSRFMSSLSYQNLGLLERLKLAIQVAKHALDPRRGLAVV